MSTVDRTGQTEEIYQGIGSSVKIAGKTFYYDDLTACDGSSTNNQTPVKGNLTRVVSWLDGGTSPEVRMAYYSYGNLACRRDAKGNTTTIGYDAGDTYPVTTTNPLGQQTMTQYYGVNEQIASGTGLYGQVKSVTDPNGAIIANEYDSLGRPTKVTMPDNTWTSRTYYNFGTVGSQYVRIDTSDGLWSENYFDGLGRTYLTKAKGPDSKIIATNTVYDARGTVRKSSLPYFYGDESRYLLTDYDVIGRVRRSGQESPTDYVRSLVCYDKDVTVKIDPNNHRRREVRDSSGRLIKIQEYTGTFSDCSTEEGSPYATTTYQYDVLGNLRFVTDAKGNQTEMRYDTLGRKRYMHDPDMGVWNYTYDANSNLQTQTDAKGQIITFGYDGLNRLKTKHNGTSLVLTNYYDETPSSNSIGRLSRMVDTSGQTAYNYDNMGRATSTVKTIDGTSYNFGFSFLNGRLNSITYPDTETVNYSYDAGYLNGVAGYVSYLTFDAMGRAKNASYEGGASSLYTFYPDTQRLQTLTVASPNQGSLIDNIYDYDNKGNVTSITDNLNKTLPTNISSETYILDASRAHAVGSTGSGRVFQYDANGNITNDGLRGISYNYDNMPTAVNSTSFAYDGSSTRVKKSSPGKTTIYIDKLYECTNGSCTKYIFAGGTRVAAKTGGQVSFFHPDHQGSTSVATDATGNKIEDIAYYPFGGTRQENGSTSDSHKYTDQERDSETGLYNYNARLYDPELGRFMSPDSIVPDPSNPQSLNRYAYVLNNPVNFTDPTGHSFWSNPLGSINDWMFGKTVDTAVYVYKHPQILNDVANAAKGLLTIEALAGSFACPGWWAFAGAVSGGAVGGYSASQAGGNIMDGILVGTAVGGATGYLAGEAFGYVGGTLRESGLIISKTAAGMAAGTISGAGSGATAGYAGGAGNSASILTGMWQGAAYGAAIGGALGAGEAWLQQSGIKPLPNTSFSGEVTGAKAVAESTSFGAVAGKFAGKYALPFFQQFAKTSAFAPIMYGAVLPSAASVPIMEPSLFNNLNIQSPTMHF